MDPKYILIGTSRSGKSTVAQKLAERFGKDKHLDVLEYVLSYIQRRGLQQKNPLGSDLKDPYRELIKDLDRGREWNILEVASDWPEEFLPEIVKRDREKITLIFCDCPAEICIGRNQGQERKVPGEAFVGREKYNADFYQDLAQKLRIEFIRVDTSGTIEQSLSQLYRFL